MSIQQLLFYFSLWRHTVIISNVLTVEDNISKPILLLPLIYIKNVIFYILIDIFESQIQSVGRHDTYSRTRYASSQKIPNPYIGEPSFECPVFSLGNDDDNDARIYAGSP